MEDSRFDNWLTKNLANPRFCGESWDYYKHYLDGIEVSTRVGYIRYFAEFLEWLDVDTEQLYSDYKAMVDDPDPRAKKKMGMQVVRFQKYLVERGLKEVTTLRAVNAIRQFFKANELELSVNRNQMKGRDQEEIPNITKDQLRQILGRCGSFRMRAVILLARDTGLRVSDVTLLRIRDIKPVWDSKDYVQIPEFPEYFTFIVNQRKTGNLANPVIGPESIAALHLWKEDRLKRGISSNDDDPVFPTLRARKTFVDKNGREVQGCEKGGFANLSTYSSTFSRLVKAANIRPALGEKKVPSIHSLRKYHKTNLEYAGVPSSWVNKLQGRKGEGSGGIYTRPNPRQLIEMYKRGYDELRILGYQSGAEEIRQLQRDKEILKDRLDNLENQVGTVLSNLLVDETGKLILKPGEYLSSDEIHKLRKKEKVKTT